MPRGNPLWGRFEKNAHRTFEEAASRWLKEFDGKTARRQAYAIEALLPYIGHLRLIDVDASALEVFKEDRKAGEGHFERPAMAGTINKELTVVSTILNAACRDWRWIPSVPRIRHVKGARRQAYPLTMNEQDRLFSQLPDNWALGAALFAVNTGVRKGELFGLRWKDRVDIPSLGTYVFILTDTKNGKDRAVICNSVAKRAVRYQKDHQAKTIKSDYVFPSMCPRNRAGRVSQSNKIWSKAWQAAGLPSDPLIRKGIHNLRHTFAHRLRAVNVPEEDRNALLGHSNVSLSQHYALPDIERLEEMAERVTGIKDTVVLRSVRSAV